MSDDISLLCRKIDDLIVLLDNDNQSTMRRRDDIEKTVNFNTAKPFILDYKKRNYIYVYAPVSTALSLNGQEYGTLFVPGGCWTLLNFPPGLHIFTVSGSAQLLVRWTDRLLNNAAPGTATLYTAAQTAVGSNNSGDLYIGSIREVSIDITTSLVTTNLQFFWDRKGADGIYYPLWQSALLTANANTISTSIGPGLAYNQSLGLIGRLRWVATGNATFTPNVYGK